MKNLNIRKMTLLGALIYLGAGILAFAQGAVETVAQASADVTEAVVQASADATTAITGVDLTPVVEADLISKIISVIGGYKEMALGALILAVVQLLIMFLKTEFAGKIFTKLTGQAKLMAVTALTIVAGYMTLTANGTPVGEAIVATLALPMVQEFLYQIYKQFFAKKV